MCRLLPTKAINKTDFDPVRKFPIFLSIETRRPGKSEKEAELQVGICLTAQWKLLQKLTSICRELQRGQPHQQQKQHLAQSVEEADPLGLTPLPGLGFLPAIIIVGHEWKFSALTVEGNKAFFWAKCPIGSTSSLVGIYRIIWGLRNFARYDIKEYWPWLLREALGLDESATVPST